MWLRLNDFQLGIIRFGWIGADFMKRELYLEGHLHLSDTEFAGPNPALYHAVK